VCLVREMDGANTGELTDRNIGPGVGIQWFAPRGVRMHCREPGDADKLSAGADKMEDHIESVPDRHSGIVRQGAAVNHEIERPAERNDLSKVANYDAVPQFRKRLVQSRHHVWTSLNPAVMHPKLCKKWDIRTSSAPKFENALKTVSWFSITVDMGDEV
jgi:hypothetical protein